MGGEEKRTTRCRPELRGGRAGCAFGASLGDGTPFRMGLSLSSLLSLSLCLPLSLYLSLSLSLPPCRAPPRLNEPRPGVRRVCSVRGSPQGSAGNQLRLGPSPHKGQVAPSAAVSGNGRRVWRDGSRRSRKSRRPVPHLEKVFVEGVPSLPTLYSGHTSLEFVKSVKSRWVLSSTWMEPTACGLFSFRVLFFFFELTIFLHFYQTASCLFWEPTRVINSVLLRLVIWRCLVNRKMGRCSQQVRSMGMLPCHGVQSISQMSCQQHDAVSTARAVSLTHPSRREHDEKGRCMARETGNQPMRAIAIGCRAR